MAECEILEGAAGDIQGAQSRSCGVGDSGRKIAHVPLTLPFCASELGRGLHRKLSGLVHAQILAVSPRPPASPGAGSGAAGVWAPGLVAVQQGWLCRSRNRSDKDFSGTGWVRTDLRLGCKSFPCSLTRLSGRRRLLALCPPGLHGALVSVGSSCWRGKPLRRRDLERLCR